MQAQMTSAQWLRNRSVLKPLPTTLIDFAVWVRYAHILSFLLTLIAPVALSPAYDGSIIAPMFVDWVVTLLKPIYEYYPYPAQIQAVSCLVVVIASFGFQFFASRRVHWFVPGVAMLIVSLGAVGVLAVLATYAVILLLVILSLPLLVISFVSELAVTLVSLAGEMLAALIALLSELLAALMTLVIVGGSTIIGVGLVLSFIAFGVLWAAAASNPRDEDDFDYQQHIQHQNHSVALQDVVAQSSMRYPQDSRYPVLLIYHPHRQNTGQYIQRVQEYNYPLDE